MRCHHSHSIQIHEAGNINSNQNIIFTTYNKFRLTGTERGAKPMLTCGKVGKIKGKRYSTEEKALQITCAHIITHMCYSARSKPWKQKTRGGDSNTTRHQPQWDWCKRQKEGLHFFQPSKYQNQKWEECSRGIMHIYTARANWNIFSWIVIRRENYVFSWFCLLILSLFLQFKLKWRFFFHCHSWLLLLTLRRCPHFQANKNIFFFNLEDYIPFAILR